MPRGTQLGDLIEMFRSEVRQSVQPSVGTDSLPHVKQLLRRTQVVLYEQFDWPFLRPPVQTISLAAGDRYYDAPDDLNFDRVERVAVRYNNEPIKVERGIDFEEYAFFDSAEDERSSPVQKWDVRWTGTTTQIEVWPVPDNDDMVLWFKCMRPLRTLVDNSDVCDLDDYLIVLFAAAEELASQKARDAELKLKVAQDYLKSLRANSQSGSSSVQMGLGRGSRLGAPTRVEVIVP